MSIFKERFLSQFYAFHAVPQLPKFTFLSDSSVRKIKVFPLSFIPTSNLICNGQFVGSNFANMELMHLENLCVKF